MQEKKISLQQQLLRQKGERENGLLAVVVVVDVWLGH
jgi:hypothetical protein